MLTCTLERISAYEEGCNHLWTTTNHRNIQRHILLPHLHMAAADLTPHWRLTWPIALISWPWGPSAVVARGGGRSNGSPALWRQSLIHPWIKGDSKVRWGLPWQLEHIYFVEHSTLVEHSPTAELELTWEWPQARMSCTVAGKGRSTQGRARLTQTQQLLETAQAPAHHKRLKCHGEKCKLSHK